MRRLEHFKFRTQLYIYFVVVVGLVIVCMWGILYVILGRSYKERENQVLTNQAKQIAINVDNRLDYYQSYMNLILSDKELVEKLKTRSYAEIETYLTNTTSEFMELNAGKISEINIYKKGYHDKVSEERKADSIFSYLEQMQSKRDSYIFSDTYLNERNEKVFSIFKKIYQGNSNREYFIEFCIYESELFGFFNEDKSGNLIYIKNAEGTVSMSDRRLFLNKLLEIRQEEYTESDEAGERIPISTYSKNGWEIVIYTDLDYLNRGLLEVLQKMVPVIGIILFCTLFIVMFISNQLNRRVGILQRKIMAIGRDEYTETKENRIEGADEFKMLGDEIDHTRLHIVHLLKEIEDTNTSQRIAEMTALRAQINSHFLFNALASIKWLARSGGGQEILSEAIDKLAIFLRYSISTEENLVPLDREVGQLEAYIYLQKLRCGEELNVVVDIEEELFTCRTVKLILQPLVENAVFHGRRQNGGALNITIYSYYEEEYYYLVVEDDGNGMTKERIKMIEEGNVEAANGGYGLQNVMSRIEICTGGEGRLTIESEKDKYTKIVIRQRR